MREEYRRLMELERRQSQMERINFDLVSEVKRLQALVQQLSSALNSVIS
jgi:hypothetical protein